MTNPPRFTPALALLGALLLSSCSDSDKPTITPASPASARPGAAAAPRSGSLLLETPESSALAMVLILDTSGSMKELAGSSTKMAIAKEVLLDDFVPLLDDDAYLALYTFKGKKARLEVALAQATQEVQPRWHQRELIMERIEKAMPDGGTPIYGSLTDSRKLLASFPGRKVVVLITDGEESFSPGKVVSAIDRNDDAGIETYVIGYALDEGGKRLENRLGLGQRYFRADADRATLLLAMQSVLAAIER